MQKSDRVNLESPWQQKTSKRMNGGSPAHQRKVQKSPPYYWKGCRYPNEWFVLILYCLIKGFTNEISPWYIDPDSGGSVFETNLGHYEGSDPYEDSATVDPKVVSKKPARKTKVKPTRYAIIAERSALKANFGKCKFTPIIATEPKDECV